MKRRLLLHVGLPKTGTSALQTWCDCNRAALRAQGLDYPEPVSEAKHQLLVPALMRNDLEPVRALLAAGDGEATTLLSTEGLSNHLYDFSEAALAGWRDATAAFDVEILLVTREPASWTRSFYRQCVVNPPVPAFHYATPLRYEDFRNLDRIERLCDHAALRRDLGARYGGGPVHALAYESDWLAAFCAIAGIDRAGLTPFPQANLSASDDLVELIRQVNALDLPAETRAGLLGALQTCCPVDHSVLAVYGAAQNTRSPENLLLTRKLSPRNSAQAAIVEQLAAWLAGATRS